MKKWLTFSVLILTVSFVIFLSGCLPAKNSDVVSSTQRIMSTSPAVTTVNSATQNSQIPLISATPIYSVIPSCSASSGSGIKFNIQRKTYKSGSITIHYPKLVAKEYGSDIEKDNTLLKSAAMHVITDSPIPDDTDQPQEVDVNGDYKITYQSSFLISVVFICEIDDKNAAHPDDELYTINLDLRNFKPLKLADVVNIKSSLISKLRKGNLYYNLSPITDKDWYAGALESIDDNFLSDDDFCTYINDSDKPVSCYYLTRDSLAVTIPEGHALLDHLETCVRYEDVKDCIQPDSIIRQIYDFGS